MGRSENVEVCQAAVGTAEEQWKIIVSTFVSVINNVLVEVGQWSSSYSDWANFYGSRSDDDSGSVILYKLILQCFFAQYRPPYVNFHTQVENPPPPLK